MWLFPLGSVKCVNVGIGDTCGTDEDDTWIVPTLATCVVNLGAFHG